MTDKNCYNLDMNKFFEKFLSFIFIFKNKNNINSTYSYNSGINKTYISATERVTFNSKSKELIDKVRFDVEEIYKKYGLNTDAMLKYIKDNGTKIYNIPFADKILALLGEEEGVIFEQKGLKAFIISLLTTKKIKFKTDVMFVFRKGLADPLSLMHNFYRWYACINNLPGFDTNSQKLFKKYLKNPNLDMSTLKIDDIMALQEAISRDKEATEFCLFVARETEGAQNVKRKLSENGGANI